MSLFQIDADKCKKDGLCVMECPVGILEMKEDGGPPSPLPLAERICLRCGHCVAVCPTAAFSLATMPAEECPPVDREHLPDLEQYGALVRTRRSIRVYRRQPVERETVEQLIDIARYAPTAKNSQQVGWLAVLGADEVRRFASLAVDWMQHLIGKRDPRARAYGMTGVVRAWEAGNDAVLRGAPALILTHAPAKYAGALIDSTIALTTLELAAAAAGLGACWAGFFMLAAADWPPILDALDLPAGETPTGALMLGYPKLRYRRIPGRKPARITWR